MRDGLHFILACPIIWKREALLDNGFSIRISFLQNNASPVRACGVHEPTLRRLPGYYRYLQGLRAQGLEVVSCVAIGRDLALDSTLVRKDLESIEAVGRRRVGFLVDELLRGIEAYLGYNGVNRAVLVGAGRLGAALLGHDKFQEYGLEIVAAFDVSPARIGERLNGIEVLPLEQLGDVAREMNAQLGIITVPAESAQGIADLLVENGIHAIWNFAPANLRIPAGVIVQNEDLYRSLATLSYRLVTKYQGERNVELPPPVED